MFAPERSSTAVVRETCPGCGFPIHPGQPAMRVHMGAVRDEEGMTDLMPVFHRSCGAGRLIADGRAKTEAQRTHHTPLIERKAS